MSVTVLVLLAALLIPVPDVSAQTVFIGPLKNANPKDVSAVWAECETSANGQQMTCNFIQVWAHLVKTPEAASAELKTQLRDATPEGMANTCKDQRREMAELAAKMAGIEDVSPRLKAFFTGWIQRFNAMCDKPTSESIREFVWYGLEKDTKTCRIWANPWKETFTRQLGDKWVSNRGPSGVCGVVIVSTLEGKPIDPEKPDSPLRLWTYETQKIVTNKDIGGPLCQFEEAKVRYSWDAKYFDRSCEFIEFGF